MNINKKIKEMGSLTELKEIAKNISREEFLKKTINYNRYCPGIVNLKDCSNYDNYGNCSTTPCYSCWEYAIKDIKFKGENDMGKVIKNYLKLGMIVETRECNKYLFINDFFSGKYSFIGLNAYNDNLICSTGLKELDIMKIYTTKGNTLSDIFDFSNLTCIWERTEDKKVTFEEAIQAYGKDICCIYHDGEEEAEVYYKVAHKHTQLEGNVQYSICPEQILNGEWYIKED